jgi:uncharacterized glyoxalase superfamily protein PhnB
MNTESRLPTVYPSFHYQDCQAAIAWLVHVLGLAPHLVVAGKGGRIDHAELKFRNGLVMISSTTAEGLDWLGEPVGRVNVSLVAENEEAVDAAYKRVNAAGAVIVRELGNSDYGPHGQSYGFTCLDPERHRWTYATYQPAARPSFGG